MSTEHNCFIVKFAASIVGLFFLAALPFAADSDRDGFSDDLERATGFNPAVDEALVKSRIAVPCANRTHALSRIGNRYNVLIVIDISGSMNLLMDASSRLDAVKPVVNRFIDALPGFIRIGIAVYGNASCEDNSIELIVPIGSMQRNEMVTKVVDLEPKGLSPIARMFSRAVVFFRGFERDNNTIVLISDSDESCGGDVRDSIQQLTKVYRNMEIRVIGIGFDKNRTSDLAAATESSGGIYFNANTADEVLDAFGDFFKRKSKMFEELRCLVSQRKEYLRLETAQFDRSLDYIKKRIPKVDIEMRRSLEQQMGGIEKNHADRMREYDMLERMVSGRISDLRQSIQSYQQKKK